jgi:glycosyltransferase involved in cell wall biosynthesis
MKIGLLIAFAGRQCGGPEVYERELVRAMSDLEPRHEYHLYCLDRRAASVIGLQHDNVVYHMLRPSVRAVSMVTSLPLAVARTRPDVFHAPVIPPPFCPANTIMSMPCSSLLRHPDLYPPLIRLRLRFLLHRAVPKAARVICPSEHVRDVLQESFKISADRLPVIYPGVSPLFRSIDEKDKQTHVQERYGIRHPYFLFSGRWEKRKNVVRTLQAFAMFKQSSRTEHKLVLTGGRSWGSAKAEQVIQRSGLQKWIVDLGKEPIDELPYLYGAAQAVVYASLWEGFGMPIIEAMACGTPVITSNVAAMPETAAGGALLVDPHSTEEIASAMHRLAADPDLRKQLRDKGLKRAQMFSWEKTARRTLDLYEEIGTGQSAGLAQSLK